MATVEQTTTYKRELMAGRAAAPVCFRPPSAGAPPR
jgi:hypothetical protein